MGEDGVAAFSVACYLYPIVFMVNNSVAESAQPIISFNYGAGNRYWVRRTFRVSFSTATICGVLATTFLTLATKPLVGHKTHKFGTLLLVKNPANGKKVVVKVIDRGPYVKGRIIDLSQRAARELGILAQRVAMVEVSVFKSQTKVPYKPVEDMLDLPEIDMEVTTDSHIPHRPGKLPSTVISLS